MKGKGEVWTGRVWYPGRSECGVVSDWGFRNGGRARRELRPLLERESLGSFVGGTGLYRGNVFGGERWLNL